MPRTGRPRLKPEVADSDKRVVREMAACIATERNTTVKDILSQSRFREHLSSRWHLIGQLSEDLLWHNRRISRAVGNHPSTVRNAIIKIGIKRKNAVFSETENLIGDG